MPKKINKPRETILNIAKEVLSTEGYTALNIRYLSKKSGVSIGTIYNHFEDKRGLDQVLMIEFWTDYEREVEAICKDPKLAFYEKLRKIYVKMDHFIQLFKELFSQLMENRNYTYTQEEKEVKFQMLYRMAKSLESVILLENSRLQKSTPDALGIAHWILNSFMTTSHSGYMTYDELEVFIRKVMS